MSTRTLGKKGNRRAAAAKGGTDKELRAFWRSTTKMVGDAEHQVAMLAWERYKSLRPNGSAKAFFKRLGDIWYRRNEAWY